MANGLVLSWLSRKLHMFARCQRGNVAMIFGLALIPLVGAVGAAVDYSRAASARTAMQAALDASALILSKEAQTLPTSQLQGRALEVFKANFHYPSVKGLDVTPTFTNPDSGSFVLKMTANGSVDTTIAGIWLPSIDISASTEAVWGMKRLELALALDNTGSMSSSNKMKELKLAAKDLIKTLQDAAKKPDDVKIAIIPFDIGVNLGTSYKDNNWFDYDQLTCNKNVGDCNSTNWKSKWGGCVRDRTYPYDAQDDAPTSANTRFPVVSSCGSLVSLMPLTNNWTALNNKIDAMQPNGNTNVTIGLVWGWHALTARAPLSEAAAPKEDLEKVIILLTDGDNTESWKNSNNSTEKNTRNINDRTKLACKNVKDANIKIYAIRVINGNAPLLRECATNSTMYYDVENASQLSTVFSAIAQNLANLRLAK